MRYAFGLLMLVGATILLQVAVFPAFLPSLLRPDVGMMVAMAALAFGTRNMGVFCVFALGVQADLFGSSRFGLLTLSYMLAAGLILWVAWRELTRGDLLAAWAGGVAGTGLAHVLYVLLGRLWGLEVGWDRAFTTLLSLLLAACVWGLVCGWLCGRFMYATGLMDHAVRERWAAEARLAGARRGRRVRA